jgi:hypothetical protein
MADGAAAVVDIRAGHALAAAALRRYCEIYGYGWTDFAPMPPTIAPSDRHRSLVKTSPKIN